MCCRMANTKWELDCRTHKKNVSFGKNYTGGIVLKEVVSPSGALPDFPRHVCGRSSRGVNWLFYFELRSFAALNNTDKIIYHVSEGG